VNNAVSNGTVRVGPGAFTSTAAYVDGISVTIIANVTSQPPTLSIVNPSDDAFVYLFFFLI
jgi:hypothetical protein